MERGSPYGPSFTSTSARWMRGSGPCSKCTIIWVCRRRRSRGSWNCIRVRSVISGSPRRKLSRMTCRRSRGCNMSRAVPESNPAEQANVTKTLVSTQELTGHVGVPALAGVSQIDQERPAKAGTPTNDPSLSDPVLEMLVTWEEQRAAGKFLTAEELYPHNAELQAIVRERIARRE